ASLMVLRLPPMEGMEMVRNAAFKVGARAGIGSGLPPGARLLTPAATLRFEDVTVHGTAGMRYEYTTEGPDPTGARVQEHWLTYGRRGRRASDARRRRSSGCRPASRTRRRC